MVRKCSHDVLMNHTFSESDVDRARVVYLHLAKEAAHFLIVFLCSLESSPDVVKTIRFDL